MVSKAIFTFNLYILFHIIYYTLVQKGINLLFHITKSEPLTFKHAACGGSTVPPPTVPTSSDGMVQLI